MIPGELESNVDRIWETMWSGGISNPLSVWLLLTSASRHSNPLGIDGQEDPQDSQHRLSPHPKGARPHSGAPHPDPPTLM